jgi:hypothetical protein
MRIHVGLCSAAVLTSLVTFGVSALAEDQQAPGATVTVAAPTVGVIAPAAESGERLPVSYTERGITNPAMILSPYVDFNVTRLQIAAMGLGAPGTSTGAELGIGTGFSITDDFGVRAAPVNVIFGSNSQFQGLTFGATYRFLKGDFEMGGALDIFVSTPSPAGATFAPSVPMRLHFSKAAILDVQPTIPISTSGSGQNLAPGGTTVGLSVPIQFAYDLIEPVFHIGANTGVEMAFNPPAPVTVGDTFGIPLGVFFGYAVPSKNGPLLDIDPYFRWPALFLPGAPAPLDKVQAGLFQAGVTVTGYIYL